MLSETVDIPNKHSLFMIGTTEVELINLGPNRGQVKIRDVQFGSFFTSWGAMGSTIERFICQINDDYFTRNLLGVEDREVFYVAGTFRNLRKYISDEIGLKWYYHLEFQKQLREQLNLFQSRCKEYDSREFFINNLSQYLLDRLDYNLIKGNFEKNYYWKLFHEINEPWHFVETKESQNARWLKLLHIKLKATIQDK